VQEEKKDMKGEKMMQKREFLFELFCGQFSASSNL
jgi:hypothetical protein